jgi:hypothetical protein
MNKVRIQPNVRNKISPADIERLTEIAAVYFPIYEETQEIVAHHVQQADSLRLARDHNTLIIGYSIASSTRRLTPFYPGPINLLYQRMLYLSPDNLYAGLGKRLLTATFYDLLGPFWLLRRFALVCRTQNPVVARMMDLHTLSYPRFGESVRTEIRTFAESLLPMLGAAGLDEHWRLLGTLESFKDKDYTEIWNRYLDKRDNRYEGALVCMLAYSKPLQFIRYLVPRKK